MTGSRRGLLGICAAALGVMAVFAIPAQAVPPAFSWLVLNEAGTIATEVKLEGGKVNLLAAVAGEIDSKNITILTRLVGVAVSVVCTSFSTLNLNLEPEGKLSAGSKFILEGCT